MRSINYTKDHGPRSLGRLQLPVETIDMIFSQVDDLASAFSLAMTNTRLMIIGEKRLHQLMAVPSWRGDRIICIGDDAQDDDLPDGILTQECQDFLRDAPNFREIDSREWDLGREAENFVDWVSCSRSGFQRFDFEFLKKQKRALSENTIYSEWKGPRLCHRTYLVYRGIIDELTDFEHVIKVPDVLWNLSKKVYDRKDAALDALEGEELNDTEVCGMMGTILQTQILWSSHDLTPIPEDVVDRGKWAGDRFELTDESVLTLRLRKDKDVWKDVSEEVIGKFVDVLKTVYEEDWIRVCNRWRRIY